MLIRQDFWAGLSFLAIAAFFLFAGRGLNLGEIAFMGPGYVPRLVALALGAVGLACVARAAITPGDRVAAPRLGPLFAVVAAAALFGLSLGSTSFFGFSLPPLGAVVGTFALCAVASRAYAGFGWIEALATAAILTLITVAVFVWIVGLSIPVLPQSLWTY